MLSGEELQRALGEVEASLAATEAMLEAKLGRLKTELEAEGFAVVFEVTNSPAGFKATVHIHER